MSARVFGTTAQEHPRRKWPFIVGSAAVVVVGGIVAVVIALHPVRIDDDITPSNAKQISRLMEAQLDAELAILGSR
jgi:hypothetical protein